MMLHYGLLFLPVLAVADPQVSCLHYGPPEVVIVGTLHLSSSMDKDAGIWHIMTSKPICLPGNRFGDLAVKDLKDFALGKLCTGACASSI